ncbi:MAG TPA: triple tyrosine motif-containing protein, partial [bacterium]|nr:triple tyrosine motif-containing protein [bacterium]
KVDTSGMYRFYSLSSGLRDSIAGLTQIWNTITLDDEVYFGSFAGVIRYHNGESKLMKRKNGFRLIFKVGNTIWAPIPGEGIYVLDRQSFEFKILKNSESLGERRIASIVPWPNGQYLLLASRSEPLVYDPAAETLHTLKSSFDIRTFSPSSCIRLKDGNYLLTSSSHGIALMDSSGSLLVQASMTDGLPTNNIKSAYQAKDGSIWLCTENGIISFDWHNPIRTRRDGQGFQGSVTAMMRYNGRMMMGTTQGLYYEKTDSLSPLLSDWIRIPNIDFRITMLDTAWGYLAVQGGEFVLLDTNFKTVFNNDFITQTVQRVPTHPDWLLSSSRNQLIRWNKKTKAREKLYDFHDEIISLVLSHEKQDDTLRYWGGFLGKGAVEIMISRDGRYLYHRYIDMPYKGYTFVNYSLGHLAANTMRGVYRFEEKNGSINVLEDNTLGPMINESKRNTFFIVADSTGYWVKAGALYHIKQINEQLWSYDSTIYLNTEVDPTGMLVDGRYLWVYGTDGVSRYDRSIGYDFNQSFDSRIRTIKTRGDSVLYAGLPVSHRDDQNLKIDFRYNNLTFEFAASYFLDTKHLQFSWKLQNFDADWTAWSSENRAIYTNLNEGEYTFRVKAMNVYGVIGREANYTFRILPPWYRTWWFRVILLGLIGVILWRIYEYRVNRLLAVERLRIKIASDLHDDIGANLSKIAMYTDLAKQSKHVVESIPILDKVGDLSRDVISSMSDIVWSIDARHDRIQDLGVRMQNFANELLGRKGVVVRCEVIGADNSTTLPLQVKQNVYLIFKEAVNNIYKYAGATEVHIRLELHKNLITLEVRDNGRGFEDGITMGGNGMKNMKMRSEVLGGRCTIESSHGVIVKIQIPVRY